MVFKVGAKTDKGLIRKNNEDAFYVDAEKGIFIIADGMGGHNAGEVASQMAVEEIKKYLNTQENKFSQILKQAIIEANKAIYEKAKKDPNLKGMGTTIVVLIVNNKNLHIAHVGDSRAYILTKEGLKQITEDHSLVNEWVKEGKITLDEARFHPMGNVITRALGVEKEVEVEINTIPYQDEPILLCTDGLTDMLEDKEIEEIIKNNPDPEQACEALIKEANEKGGKDNVTVILIKKT